MASEIPETASPKASSLANACLGAGPRRRSWPIDESTYVKLPEGNMKPELALCYIDHAYSFYHVYIYIYI